MSNTPPPIEPPQDSFSRAEDAASEHARPKSSEARETAALLLAELFYRQLHTTSDDDDDAAWR